MKKHRGEYPMPAIQIPGWMSSPELEWLYQRAKENRIIVEVGCAYGRSSHALLTGNWEGFGHEGRVYCVDPWPKPVKGSKDQFDFSFKDTSRRSVFFQRCGYFPNLSVIELISSRAWHAIRESDIGMVFLDGGTAQMRHDIIEWWHKPNKILCGHDHSDEYLELKAFIERMEDVKFVTDTSIWYVERQ